MSNYTTSNLVKAKAIDKAKAIKIGDKIFVGFYSEPQKIYKCATVGTGTWTGYLYDQTTHSIASTTTSLTYSSSVAPTVGNYYTEDGEIQCSVYSQVGVVFYAPLASSKATAETGQTLTETGSPTFTTLSGVPCVQFDGSTQWITTPPTGLPSGSNGSTVSLFCKVDSTSSYDYLMLFQYGADGQHVRGAYVTKATGIVVYSDGGADLAVSSNSVLDAWHHIVCISNGTTHQLYIDGVLVNTGTGSLDTTIDKTFTLGAGTDLSPEGGTYYHNFRTKGCFAEVKVWNRAITQAEITAEYNRLQAMVTA